MRIIARTAAQDSRDIPWEDPLSREESAAILRPELQAWYWG